ncbi:MAG: RNA polymerase sigma-70 factor (ECF subfamily) [Planctomycetota bacterium]
MEITATIEQVSKGLVPEEGMGIFEEDSGEHEAGQGQGQGQGQGPWRGLSELEPGLRRLLLLRCSDENDVDDVIQETYLRAARYRDSVKDPSRLWAWTARIALNVHSDLRRCAQRTQRLPGADEEEEANLPSSLVVEEEANDVCVGSEMMASEDALELVQSALFDLREADRSLLEYFYRDECNVPECARRLAVPAQLVKVRLYRARRRLLGRAERILSTRRFALTLGMSS